HRLGRRSLRGGAQTTTGITGGVLHNPLNMQCTAYSRMCRVQEYAEWRVSIPSPKGQGFYHCQAKASCPNRGAINSGWLTTPLVARFLAALVSAWHVKPHRMQENSAWLRRMSFTTKVQYA